jgi:hypothetical protein
MKHLLTFIFALALCWPAFGQTKSIVTPLATTSTANTLPRYDGTTGQLVKTTGVVVSDANAITAGDGTQALPTFSFLNDPNTGIFSSAANSIGFTTDGTERWLINASGAFNPILDDTYDIGNGIVNPRDIHFSDQLVGMQGTITASAPILDLSSTWNNAGVTFTGLKYNVTDTASAAGSLLMDLQVGGNSKLRVSKTDGVVMFGADGQGWGSVTSGTTVTFGRVATATTLSATCWGFLNNNAGDSFTVAGTLGIGTAPTARDLVLVRDAAATLQMGADAATATAQKLKAHDGSGTDKTGADMTIAAGIGTGTASGGSLYLQTGGVGGASGSSLNTLTNRVTISPTGSVTIAAPSSGNGLNVQGGTIAIDASTSGATRINAISGLQFGGTFASINSPSNGRLNFSDNSNQHIIWIQNGGYINGRTGSGTDAVGYQINIRGGSGTGTGAGGPVILETALSGSTGTATNSMSTRTYQNAKPVTLTESAATTIATIAVGSSKYVGAKLFVTVNAADATDFQALSSTLNVNAVNKAGTVTPTITQVDGTTAASTGTLTATYTVTTSGNNVIIQCNALSSLTQTTLNAKWSIETLNSDDTAAVTVP